MKSSKKSMQFARVGFGATLPVIVISLVISTTVAFAQSTAASVATQQGSDEELAEKVKAALHADPYVYDGHIHVAVEQGNVVLRGFVFSDWDLRNAIRIASESAGGHKVIDDISIKEGGRH